MKIAVLDDYQNVAKRLGPWQGLPGSNEVVSFTDHTKSVDELARRLAPFDAVVAMRERTPIPAALIDKLPNLKLIVTTGLRNPSIDTDHANGRGIVCCGAPSASVSTAELAFSLVIGLQRGTFAAIDGMRAHGWQAGSLPRQLGGATLGILGLGHLGQSMANHARPFGMNLISWSRNMTPERAAKAGVAAVGFEELFEKSDILSVHLRLNEGTTGLVGRKEIARMKKGAYLVNISRGPIVDEAALVDALKSGQLGGAGLDVFDEEPLPRDSPLRTAPNVYMTPHLGYVSEPAFAEFYQNIVAAVGAFIKGEPIRVIK